MSKTEELTAWDDDTALMGPKAPKWNGQIEHLIRYLLTVHKRFGNTAITCGLQWGASALWKRDEQAQKIAELEAELDAAKRALAEERSGWQRKDLEARNAGLFAALMGIHNLLPPPPFEHEGKWMRFNYPESLSPNDILHALAKQIREIPAALAAKKKEGP